MRLHHLPHQPKDFKDRVRDVEDCQEPGVALRIEAEILLHTGDFGISAIEAKSVRFAHWSIDGKRTRCCFGRGQRGDLESAMVSASSGVVKMRVRIGRGGIQKNAINVGRCQSNLRTTRRSISGSMVDWMVLGRFS